MITSTTARNPSKLISKKNTTINLIKDMQLKTNQFTFKSPD